MTVPGCDIHSSVLEEQTLQIARPDHTFPRAVLLTPNRLTEVEVIYLRQFAANQRLC